MAGPAAVVCLHASVSSSAQWRPLMDHLAGRYRVLAADLYGCGGSPNWPGHRPLSLADEAALIEPILAARDRLHLVGHSYGGAVALRAALAAPHRLESLVLFEPVLFSVLLADDPTQPGAREIVAVRNDSVAAIDVGRPDLAAARFIDYWMGVGAWRSLSEARRARVSAAMHSVPAEWDAILMDPTPLSAFATLDMPILLITGSESPISSKEVARLLTKNLPLVTVVEIEGVGHMGPVTHADRVNALIAGHLDRHHERTAWCG
jgi:pimeloyl-ACP methyl ester carboxylesterase